MNPTFTNVLDAMDVQVDGSITVTDVLLIINHINANSSTVAAGSIELRPSELTDVNRDGHVTALDALIVINYLNPLGSAESEATPPAPSDYFFEELERWPKAPPSLPRWTGELLG